MRALEGILGHPLVRATLRVMGLGFGIKLLALVKEMAVAGRLGVSRDMDTFTLAFGFASFLVSLLAGNLKAAFIPAYTGMAVQCNGATTRSLYGRIRWRLALALSAVALAIGLNLGRVAHGLAPKWSAADLLHLGASLRILLLWVPIYGMTFLSAAALQAEERFMAALWVTAISPLAILAVVTCASPVHAGTLAWGVVLGGTVEGLLLAWVLRATPPPPLPVDDEAISRTLPRVWSQYLPTLAAGILINTTPLVDLVIAGRLPQGAVSALAYGNKLPAVAMALSAGALGTTLLPALSRMAGERDFAGIRLLVRGASALAMAAGALAVLVLGAGSPLIVKVLFQRGAFQAAQVGPVAWIQCLYLLQLPFHLAGIVMVHLICALQGNPVLVWGTLLTASLNLGLDLLFLPYLGAKGIALASACATVPTWLFLSLAAFRLLRRRERAALDARAG